MEEEDSASRDVGRRCELVFVGGADGVGGLFGDDVFVLGKVGVRRVEYEGGMMYNDTFLAQRRNGGGENGSTRT